MCLVISNGFSTLQSRSSSAPLIPPHRTQIHPRIHPFSSVNSRATNIGVFSREKCFIFLALLIIFSFVLYLFSIARGVHSSSTFTNGQARGYGIIIEAENSGSRIHVFEYISNGNIPFVSTDGKGSVSMKSNQRLYAFASQPKDAGGSLLSLLNFAKKRIPSKEWAGSVLQLLVTTGLDRVDWEGKRIILESCRQVLRSSGFLFKDEWASVITGRDEGIFAWVAANYALGTLGDETLKTNGVIELGGASLQVAFIPMEPPPLEFSRTVKLGGITYNLYVRSLLHLGQDGAWESSRELYTAGALKSCEPFAPALHCLGKSSLMLQSISEFVVSFIQAYIIFSESKELFMDPCTPRGYSLSSHDAYPSTSPRAMSGKKLLKVNSTGNFSACVAEVSMLLGKATGQCIKPPCRTGSFVIPELEGNYFNMQDFYFTSKFFGLVPRASLLELMTAGEHYCEVDWNKLTHEHNGINEDLLMFCFSSAYTVALLKNGFGVPMDAKRIGFANQVGSVPIDWTLGAFILQTAIDAEPDAPGAKIWTVGRDSHTFFSFVIILFLAILFVLYVSKWQKPQVKTIYDLEKGRYIITRIPR